MLSGLWGFWFLVSGFLFWFSFFFLLVFLGFWFLVFVGVGRRPTPTKSESIKP